MDITPYMQIYPRIADDLSRKIYVNRILWSFTQDKKYAAEIVNTNPYAKATVERLKARRNVAFGAGNCGRILTSYYAPYFDGTVDNDPALWGGVDDNEIFPPSALNDKFADKQVCITIFGSVLKPINCEILSQLEEMGIEKDRILDLGQVVVDLANKQYFDLPQLPHDDEEVFVDAGCLDGGTSLNFMKWSGDYKHIYAFELTNEGATKCGKNLREYIDSGKLTLTEAGLYSDNTTVRYSLNRGASSVQNSGDYEAKVVKLDDVLEGKRVTFIKMDIEGSEYAALTGAEKTIAKHHPKLAICVYHKPEDIIEIPQKILSIDDSYKFYLRSYSLWPSETILYGV